MKNLTLTTLFLLGVTFVIGQNPRSFHVFSGTIGLDMSHHPPTQYASGMVGKEANASISNENGELLFYTNGGNSPTYTSIFGGIFNRNHEVMENGAIWTEGGCISSYRGTVIIPFPAELGKVPSNKYYVITRDCVESWAQQDSLHSGLTYAVVNMNANGGLGAVESKYNTIEPHEYINVSTDHEQVRVTTHSNGRDYWLWFYNRSHLRRILVTSDGFQPSVEFPITFGGFSFSPSNQHMTIANDIYDFNDATGDIVLIDSIQGGSQAFSSNGEILYAFEQDGKLYQYDMNSSDIYNSKNYITNSSFQGLYLAPNHIIYTYSSGNNNSLPGRIECPNKWGVECNFEINPIQLTHGNLGSSFSNLIAPDLYYNGEDCYLNAEEFIVIDIQITPNPSSDVFTFKSPVTINSYTLHDLSGKLILNQQVNSTLHSLSLSHLKNGTYLLNLITKNEVVQKKIIKL